MTTHDHSALESMMLQHGPFLRRLAGALVRDEHRAEDLVQDTWVAASQTETGSLSHPRAWLATVLRRGAVSSQRRDAVSAPPTEVFASEAELPPHPMDEAAVAEQLERERLLRDAVEALEEPYRSAVFLRYHEGLGPKEIADATGVPIKTINTRLHRGLAKLRDDLDQRFGGDEEGCRAWFTALAPLVPGRLGAPSRAVPGASVAAKTATGGTAATLKVLALCAAAVAVLVVGYQGLKPAAAVPSEGTGIQHIAAASAPEAAGGSGPELASLVPAAGAPGAAEPRSLGTTVAAASETATLRVSVTDARGEPARDCLLVAYHWGEASLPRQHRTLRTDEGGVATFAFAPGARVAVEDGFSRASAHVEGMPAAGETEEMVLRLSEGVSVSGRVLNARGEPVAGATIYGSVASGLTPMLVPVASSGADGSYGFSAGESFDFQGGFPGEVPSARYSVMMLAEDGGAGLIADLKLGGAGTTLTGRVLDAAGEPLGGVTVHAGPRGNHSLPGSGRGYAPSPVVATTADDGSFTYPVALASGDERICAFKEGYATTTIRRAFDGGETHVDLVLMEGVTLTGRVLKPDGTPLVNATVGYRPQGTLWTDRGYGPRHNAKTDASGTYRLEHMGAGAISLRSESHYSEELAQVALDMVVAGDADQTQDLTISYEPLIQGIVTDSGGQPVEGVRVDAVTGLGMIRYPREVLTDSGGRFRLTCLPDLSTALEPEKGFEVVVLAHGVRPAPELGRASAVQPGTDDVAITIEGPVTGTAEIVGQLVNPTEPIPRSTTGFLWVAGGKPGDLSSQTNVVLDLETGEFRAGPLAEGPYFLEFCTAEKRIASRTGIEVTAGATVDLGEVTVGAGGHFELTVDFDMPSQVPDSERQGLLNDQHFALHRSGMEVELERTELGWTAPGSLEPGEWTLHKISGEALVLPSRTVTIPPGETTTLDATAEIGGRVLVTVLFPTDGSWSHAAIASRSTDGVLQNQTRARKTADADENDSIRFMALALPGETRFVLVLDGEESGVARTVTVKPLFEGNDPIELDAR